ncbi:MAG: sigma-70 family RNA polymerase sigma factor [Thermomicrobiales bacterium]
MECDQLAGQFEEHRSHLRAVAYRMLGSLAEAEDAVQETWLRLSRTDANEIDNLGGWLRQVVSRISLDMLRSRKARREDSLDSLEVAPMRERADTADPEQEALMADDIGLALLVVMERLDPAERLAFVLHDMFAVPFDEIARIVDRTPAATRQLASRARRRVHGPGTPAKGGNAAGRIRRTAVSDAVHLDQQRAVVDAFLAAARAGDLQGVLAVLDPDVVFRTAAPGGPQEVRGAGAVAPLAMRGRAVAARPILVNGNVGVVVAPRGHLIMVLNFVIQSGKVIAIDAFTEQERVAALELAVLDT